MVQEKCNIGYIHDDIIGTISAHYLGHGLYADKEIKMSL
jgi:hypothetical protein